ncbi:hypothetical protein [Wenxinia saemankumensis]|uniref:Dihydrodipicolinate reductase n=1 Tax=Wenxinia saemankumensis TaxID=1447782 RepID=A0A1M6EBH2_9RHOB|nr:hypothetical protein [Wenxinia saemankumensis]SHI82822.1 hypothetical protein SAMN05444417_1918 [Wenxinia saemankumensis]
MSALQRHRPGRRRFAFVLALCGWSGLLAVPAKAEDYRPVTERTAFLALVEGRTLSIWLMGVTIRVGSDGSLTGESRGRPMIGRWTWQNGTFCHEIEIDGITGPADCQRVEALGETRLRLTSRGGRGESTVYLVL